MAKAKKKPEKRKVAEIFDEKHGELVEMVISKLGEDLSWEKPWTQTMPPCPVSGITGKPYRGGNHVNLLIAEWFFGYEDPRWFTYRKLKANGWKLKEGEYEKAGFVEHWGRRFAIVDKAENRVVKSGWIRTDKKTGKPYRPKYDEETQELHIWMAPHSYKNVWNAEQVEGIGDAEPEAAEGTGDVPDMPEVDELIASSRCPVHESGQRACYIPGKDEIHVPEREKFGKPDEFASTVAHEMSHSTAPVLGRDMTGPFGSAKYALEELVAEFGSMFVCSDLGIEFTHKVDREENSAAYIASWLKSAGAEDKAATLYTAAKSAEKAASYIVGRLATA